MSGSGCRSGGAFIEKDLTHFPGAVEIGVWRTFRGGAARAAGRPEQALSDGYQSLNLVQFNDVMARCRAVAAAIGKKM